MFVLDEKFDQMFKEAEIGLQFESFIHSFFGYLHRRTNFFSDVPSAKKMVTRVLDTWTEAPSLSSMVVSNPIMIGSECEVQTSPLEEKIPKTEKSSSNSKDDEISSKRDYTDTETFNGADCGGYRWSQNLSEVDISVPVPSSIKKGSQVSVNFAKKHLTVKVAGEVILDGELCHRIKDQDSIWNLEPSQKILISLEKVKHEFWTKLLVGHDELDPNKFKLEQPLDQLGGADRQAIEETLKDCRNAQKPRNQEKMSEFEAKLRQAWNQDDSPFKGTLFDPSLLQFTK